MIESKSDFETTVTTFPKVFILIHTRQSKLRKATHIIAMNSNSSNPENKLSVVPVVIINQPCNQTSCLAKQVLKGPCCLKKLLHTFLAKVHLSWKYFLSTVNQQNDSQQNSSWKHCIFLLLTDKHDDKISGCSFLGFRPFLGSEGYWVVACSL